MTISRLFRIASFLILGTISPAFLTQCKTGAGSYKDVEYDPAMLKTPAGHGLEKKDYPFDDNGAYRKDWVKNKAKGKTRSAYDAPEPAVADESVAETGTTAPAPYPTYAQASEARNAEVTGTLQNIDGATTSASIPVAPPTTATVVSGNGGANYHTVVTGDTLFALSQRYQTSVSELKRVNGLTDDAIRTGQTLRLP